MANQASTPSTASRSRASTVVLDSSDRGTPAPGHPQLTMTPSRSTPASSVRDGDFGGETQNSQANGFNKFTPFQMLMETEIKLEFGDDLQESKIIHEEMLCCHSEAARLLFQEVKALRQAYGRIDQQRKVLKDVFYSRVAGKANTEEVTRQKAITAIAWVYTKWPYPKHRKEVKEVIVNAVHAECEKRNFITTQTQSKAQIAKEVKEMEVLKRLTVLTVDAILAVAGILLEELREIKQISKEEAKADMKKAAAQRRYILPGVKVRVIRSLAHWMYRQGGVIYEDAEHLYEIYDLATKLGTLALTEQCLSKLISETESRLETALAEERHLLHVLGLSLVESGEGDAQVDTGDEFVQAVFSHILKDDEPPERLITLVTTTLAKQLTPELWELLKDDMSHAISLRILKAMVDHQQVKQEEPNSQHFQREDGSPEKKRARLAQHGKTEPN